MGATMSPEFLARIWLARGPHTSDWYLVTDLQEAENVAKRPGWRLRQYRLVDDDPESSASYPEP
jgi:hypothetical protein